MTNPEMAELLLRDMAQECQDMARYAPVFEALRLLELSDQLAGHSFRIWEKQWDEVLSNLQSRRFDA